jgi:hypothetical protein
MILYALKVTRKSDNRSFILVEHPGVATFESPEQAKAHGESLYGKDNPHVTYKPIIFGYDVE